MDDTDPTFNMLEFFHSVQAVSKDTIELLKSCKDAIDDDHLPLFDRAITTIDAQNVLINQLVELHFDVRDAVEEMERKEDDSKSISPSGKSSKGSRKW